MANKAIKPLIHKVTFILLIVISLSSISSQASTLIISPEQVEISLSNIPPNTQGVAIKL